MPDEEFWLALHKLFGSSTRFMDESGRLPHVRLLMRGPGSERLEEQLVGCFTLRDGLAFLADELNIIEALKLGSCLKETAMPNDDLGPAIAALIADRAAELATSARRKAAC